jgi:fucose 4-O-acetylase-like acetyltransferase
MKNEIENQKKRAGDADLLRGIGILLMILGHVYFGAGFDKYIHAFHMPLWFVISGFFADVSKDTKKHVAKRIKTLLIPFIVFGFIYEMLWTVTGHNQWIGFLFPNSIEIPLNGGLWFLPAMFIADIVCFGMLKCLPEVLSYILIVSVSVFGCLHTAVLPFSADSAMVGMGFFLMGYLLKRFGHRLLQLRIWTTLAILSGDAILILLNDPVNMRLNLYGMIPVFWINAAVTIIALWNICKWIDKKKDLKVIKEIGSQSIIYVCINQILLTILTRISVGGGNTVFSVLWKGIEAIAIVAVCFISNRIIIKTPLRILLGK